MVRCILAGLCAGVVSVTLSGCAAFQQVDMPATYEAANIAYATEAAQLQRTGTQERILAQATHQAEITAVAAVNAVNQQLAATLALRITPTVDLLREDRPDDMGLTVDRPDGSGGNTSAGTSGRSAPPAANVPFRLTGTSSSVRADDGCVQNPVTTFPLDVGQIYVTFVASELTAGTALRADWYFEDQIVNTAAWTPGEDYAEICVWFFIEQGDVIFAPGNWSVRVFANDTQIGGTQTFTFRDNMMSDSTDG